MNVKSFNEKVNCCHKELKGLLNRAMQDKPELVSSVLKDSINVIEDEISRNELGLVRVLFLGASSSGKSTMINGIVRKIVVPEVMHTSTLLPTWIGLSDDNAKHCVNISYHETNKAGEIVGEIKTTSVDYNSFRCEYCYTREDIVDRGRCLISKKFKGRELHEAYMCVPNADGIMYDCALTLVDTLGHGVSYVDDEKAKQNMKNCDMAFILLDDSAQMTSADLNFFASTLFNPEISRISPKDIIFVINKIDRSQAPSQAIAICKRNIESMLQKAYGDKIPDKLYDTLCEQIITYSALYVRSALNGLYPYEEDALKINGWSKEKYDNAPKDSVVGRERQIVAELVKYDEDLSYIPKERLLEKSGYEEMLRIVGLKVKEMIEDGTIHKNHFADIERIASEVVNGVNETIKSFEVNKNSVDEKMNHFNGCKNNIDSLTSKLSEDAQILIKSFPGEVNGYIKTNSEQLLQQSVGDVNNMINNLRFNVNESIITKKTLGEMTLQQIEETLLPSFMKPLDEIIAIIIKTFCDGVLTTSIVEGSIKNSPSDEFRNKFSQLLYNHIAQVQTKINELNADHLFKVTPISKEYFVKKIESSLNQSQLTLISSIQNTIECTLNAGLADKLQLPLRGLWNRIKNAFRSPKHIIADMEKIGQNVIREYIYKTVSGNASSGNFLNNEATADIVSLLNKSVNDCNRMVTEYMSSISIELESLKKDLEIRKGKLEEYKTYQNRMNIDLNEIMQKLETIKDDVKKNGVECL